VIEVGHGDVIEIGSEELHVIATLDRLAKGPVEDPVTLHGDATAGPSDTVDEPAGLAQRHILELAEELLLRGAECVERDAIGQTICAMVDTLVRDFERAGNRLTPGESVRLVSVSQIAAQWGEAPDLRDWSAELQRTLAP
jgi:hypothetical protein